MDQQPNKADAAKAASILGSMSRGKPKTISDQERERRRQVMIKLNAIRAAKKQSSK